MILSFNFYFSTLIMLSYWITLSQHEILMKIFNQVFAILITAALFFGCPPKHEEPVNGSLVPTSRSEHLVMGNPSSAVDSVSSVAEGL